MNAPRRYILTCFLLAPLLATGSIAAEVEEQEKARKSEPTKLDMRSMMPRWGLGDRWTVETVNRRLQVRHGDGDLPIVEPIQWHFAVSSFEKSLEHDCFRVEVTCAAGPQRQPRTILWVDRDSMALRRVTMEVPTVDGFQPISVYYEFDSGQPAPVLGPLTTLPIDLPAFLASGAKGLETFEYTTFHGEAEAKGLDEIGFAERVQQRVAQAPADEVRKLLRGSFEKSLENDLVAKSLDTKPITDVRLQSQGQEVRQLWQPGHPWPIYSDNGLTVCHLVSVTPAKEGAEEENDSKNEAASSAESYSPNVQP